MFCGIKPVTFCIIMFIQKTDLKRWKKESKICGLLSPNHIKVLIGGVFWGWSIPAKWIFYKRRFAVIRLDEGVTFYNGTYGNSSELFFLNPP